MSKLSLPLDYHVCNGQMLREFVESQDDFNQSENVSNLYNAKMKRESIQINYVLI